MRIMVLGGGGREHAIITKLLESSSQVENIFWAGTKSKSATPKVEVVDLDLLDFPQLVAFAKEKKVTYTVVGPELPLTEGIVDYFQQEGLLIFGPNKQGAKMEGSKTFAKDIMLKYGVPTAKYIEIEDLARGKEIIKRWGTPIVIKVDGLAQGKGVVIPTTEAEAFQELEDMLAKYPNQKVFAEEFFVGSEVSFMAVVSKNKFLSLVPARDYKRIHDGNEGPNTGGMGSIAYKGLLSPEESSYIEENVLQRTLEGLEAEGIEFTGILYAGMIMTLDGPKVLEFNTRLGDPEAQSILELMEDDFAQLLHEACRGNLPKVISFSDKVALTLVMASDGYPGKYKTGLEINGLEKVVCKVFEAGTNYVNGKTVTAGGRVLNLTTMGDNVEQCRRILYKEQQKVTFLGKYFRNDIGN